MEKWVSVDYRLPELNVPVLISGYFGEITDTNWIEWTITGTAKLTDKGWVDIKYLLRVNSCTTTYGVEPYSGNKILAWIDYEWYKVYVEKAKEFGKMYKRMMYKCKCFDE